MPLKKREGDWVELTFAMNSGTVAMDGERKWPIADLRVPSSDPRDNYGMYFGLSSHLTSKVANSRMIYSEKKRVIQVSLQSWRIFTAFQINSLADHQVFISKQFVVHMVTEDPSGWHFVHTCKANCVVFNNHLPFSFFAARSSHGRVSCGTNDVKNADSV